MGFFGRRKRAVDTAPPSDRTDLGIARVALDTLVDLGVENPQLLGSDADDLQLIAGEHRLPLYNLISRLREIPVEDWRSVIRSHLAAILAPKPDFAALDADSLREQIRTRLLPADDELPITLSYARPFAAGLVVALSIDFPDTVSTLGDEHVGELALSVDELFEAGRVNVNTEPIDENAEVMPGLFVAEGRSLFVGTRATDLPELLTEYGVDAPFGAVFAVPHRQMIVYSPITAGILERMPTLINIAQRTVRGEYGSVPGGPVSGNLYLWDADGYECVGSEGVDDETFAITVTPRLHRALDLAGD